MRPVTVVIPCFNEALRLPSQRFLDAVRTNDAASFVFVNDGSADATATVIDELCAKSPEKMRGVHLAHNVGKAEAVRQGVLAALAREDVSFVGYWDADLATPLTEIERLASMFDDSEIDIVMGSRVKLLGRQIERRATRHYIGRVFATAASVVLGVPVYDTQCGAKLFRKTPRISQVFSKPFEARWVFDVEILARLLVLAGPEGRDQILRSIVEVPLQRWTDVPASKLTTLDFVRATAEIARIGRLRIRGTFE